MEKRTFIEKNIENLSKEDYNVAVSGIIVNKDENSFILDDGTGQLYILMSTNLNNNNFVRVFGRILPYEEGIQLQGFIIQDLSKIDKYLYKKVKELLK